MDSQKLAFSADGFSEKDRIAALERLIHEFNLLKSQKNDDLNQKRRQMLLSIWGDLVLARNDPSQINQALTDPVELPSAEALDASGIDQGPIETAAGLDHSHDNAPEIENAGLKEGRVDEVDSVIVVDSADENQDDAHFANDTPAEEGGIEDHIAVALHDDHDLSASVSHELANEHKSEAPVQTIQDLSKSPEPQTIDITRADASAPESQVTAAIRTVDERAVTQFVIQGPHDEEKSSPNLVAMSSTEENSTEATLARIFDVKSSDDQPLLEIKDVAETTYQQIDQNLITSENIEVEIPDMVRLRLLKTGTLHDMVLPQGTIISTNSADAEELISSGTAEKLLIQTESVD